MFKFKNRASVSALACLLTLEKLHAATFHTDLSQAILSYSRSLSRLLADFGEQDASIAGILRDFVFVALEHETAKRGDKSGRHMTAETEVEPLFFMLPDEQEEPEDAALKILTAARAIETRANEILVEACLEPAAREISAVIDLEALTRISARRANALKQIVDEINSGSFWHKANTVKWLCLQCGEVVEDRQAFDECPCCRGGRECAAAQ